MFMCMFMMQAIPAEANSQDKPAFLGGKAAPDLLEVVSRSEG